MSLAAVSHRGDAVTVAGLVRWMTSEVRWSRE